MKTARNKLYAYTYWCRPTTSVKYIYYNIRKHEFKNGISTQQYNKIWSKALLPVNVFIILYVITVLFSPAYRLFCDCFPTRNELQLYWFISNILKKNHIMIVPYLFSKKYNSTRQSSNCFSYNDYFFYGETSFNGYVISLWQCLRLCVLNCS